MTYGDLERLAVSKDDELLWDGRPLKTVRRFTLSFWPALGAIVVAVGTLAQGIAALYQMGVGLGWWAAGLTGSAR